MVFDDYPSEKLDKLFDTKSLFLAEIEKVLGDNNYTIKPHKKRRK